MAIFEPVIDALARAGVRSVIVGGVAVVLHGYARLTADLDLAVDLSPPEKMFSLRDQTDPMVVVDLFVTNPIEFATLWERSEEVELYGRKVRIASIPDLIATKRLADRPQDEADIDALEEILRLKESP